MNSESKTQRKRKRFAARLQSSKGIICTDTPGPNIVLCNAGQATGLEKEHIYRIIKQNELNTSLPQYIAEKGETYAYLKFDCNGDAQEFYEKCNGKIKVDENGPPLYMSYVDKVPNTEKMYPAKTPQGLALLNNFITVQEEEMFIKLFDWSPEPSNLKNRQVKHYGYEFKYGSNNVDLNSPLDDKIPTECDILWSRLKEHGFEIGVPDQLTVNKYDPGHGIPSHVDKHSPFGGTILSLSLSSDVVMDWKHHSGRYLPLLVQARSLLVMQDEARYDWQHGIQPRIWDPVIENRSVPPDQVIVVTNERVLRSTRISLTFRWTRTGPCSCVYKTLCDTAKTSLDDLQDEVASNLEELHVHQVYEQIAGHFSTTRHKPWPRVVQFVRRVPAGCLVLDLGSGNGKNILHRTDIMQVACERSEGLLRECASRLRGGSVAAADCVRLDLRAAPLRDGIADALICIAVLHHFSTKARRIEAMSTIHRLLRRGGRALITVWARDQTHANYLRRTAPTSTSPSTSPSSSPSPHTAAVCGTVPLPVHENRTQFQHADLLVPWKLRQYKQPEETLLRFYHVFEQDELENLCVDVGLSVSENFYEEGNWCVICEKK